MIRIGEVAERVGVTPRTIRYYEEIGLLPGGARVKGAHRLYDDNDVERLTELTRLRDLLNLSLDELKELVEAEEARAVLRRRLNETDSDDERVEIIEAALPYIDRQLDLVRRQRASWRSSRATSPNAASARSGVCASCHGDARCPPRPRRPARGRGRARSNSPRATAPSPPAAKSAARPRSAGRSRAPASSSGTPSASTRRELAVARVATGAYAVARELECTVDRGHPPASSTMRTPLRSAISCACPNSPKPVTSVTAFGANGRSTSAARLFSVASTDRRRAAHVAPLRAASTSAGAERLRQEERVAGLRAALRPDAVRVHGADDGEPVLRLVVADRVAAGEQRAGCAHLLVRGGEDRGQHLVRQLLRERGDRQREQRRAAHREDVVQRVRRGDRARTPPDRRRAAGRSRA